MIFFFWVQLFPYIDECIGTLIMQVVNQLQSGSKSKKHGWMTELPRAGLGVGVLDNMKAEKRKDVAWQGKCSGTVYVCSYWTIN